MVGRAAAVRMKSGPEAGTRGGSRRFVLVVELSINALLLGRDDPALKRLWLGDGRPPRFSAGLGLRSEQVEEFPAKGGPSVARMGERRWLGGRQG